MEKNIKKKICEKQQVTFECTRHRLWLKKKQKPKRMYLYTQTANINFITVRINYFFNSQLVNSEWGRGAKIFLFLLPTLDKQEQKTASYTGASSLHSHMLPSH